MAYYPKDAAVMERLRKQIEALGMPLVLMRKFNQLIGSISVQVEDEFTSRRVITTVFGALVQQAEEIKQPECDRIKMMIDDCRLEIGKRLDKREARTTSYPNPRVDARIRSGEGARSTENQTEQ
jgi:hypothetical protein